MKYSIKQLLSLLFIFFINGIASASTLNNENDYVDLLDTIEVKNFSQIAEHKQLQDWITKKAPHLTDRLNQSRWQIASIKVAPNTESSWLALGNRGMWEDLVVVIAEKNANNVTVLYELDIYNSGPMLMQEHWIPLSNTNEQQIFDIYISIKLEHEQLPLQNLEVMTDTVKQDRFFSVLPFIYSFYSSLGILLLYNLMLFWRLRVGLHVVYAIYCLSILTFVGLRFSTFYTPFLYTNFGLSLRDTYTMAGLLFVTFMLLFFYFFLEPAYRNLKLWRLNFLLASLTFVQVFFFINAPYESNLIPDVSTLSKMSESTFLCVILLTMAIIVQAWKRGSKDAPTLFLAQSIPLAIMFIHLFARVNDISSSSWITYHPFAVPLAYVFEMFILSYAMAERVRRVRDQSILAKVESEHKLKMVLKEQNEKLELQVKERTQALEDAKRVSDALARTDTLTGLNNRRALFEEGESIFKDAKYNISSYAVILLDIDNFKRVNDTYGHAVGDKIIQSLANSIRAIVNKTDLCSRIGGEEFVIILPNTPLETAFNISENLRYTVAETPIDFEFGELRYTISLGVSVYLEVDNSLDDSLSRADKALYQSKNTGRNKTSIDNVAITEALMPKL